MCNLNLYDYEENFSKRLIELRGQKNQQEICDTIGITTATLRRYEKGETKPDIIIAKKLADYYEVSLDELFDENYEKGKEDAFLNISCVTGLSIKSIKRIIDKSNDKHYMKILNYYIESGEIDSIIYALSALETISKPVLNINKSPNYIKHFHEDKTIDILDNALKILSSIVDEFDASVIHKGTTSELEKYTQFLKATCLNENQEDLEHDALD